MTYIENIFICISAPLLVGIFCAGPRRRAFVFCLIGYAACLLSAYINTFFAGLYGADVTAATVEITPVVEEVLKLLPLLFYLVVLTPEKKDMHTAILTISASFATFENICYLTENGASELSHLLIRGFGTGAMHIVCGALVGYGLLYVWSRPLMKFAGTFGLLCAAISYHAIFNLLMSAGGVLQIIGYVIPIATVLAGVTIGKLVKRKRAE